MDGRITKEQLKQALSGDFERLPDEVVEALESLRDYIGERVAMTDYPRFRQSGYDCGSGPTESLCGRLTDRIKGPGMKWDGSNAEAMMALLSLYHSDLWSTYWKAERAAA
jgi:hypothetical protein